MKMGKVLCVLIVMLMLFSVAACTPSAESNVPIDSTTPDTSVEPSDSSKNNEQSVTLNVMGEDITYEKAPERAIPIGYENAQVLLALGLEDKIAACTSAHFKIEECLPEYQQKLQELNVVGEQISFEALLAENPDLVYGHNWSFNESDIAPLSDFLQNNINIYAVSGSYAEKSTVQSVYDDILNLGKIFRVEDRAEELVAQLKERMDKVEANKVSGSPSVFVYDSGDKQAYTAGNKALQTQLIEIAGGKNLFDDLDTKYENVSWEEVAARNPQWILINDYEDENMTETKEEFIKNNPALANVDAVKNNRIICINLTELREGIQMVDGAEKILEAFQAAEQ